MTKKEPRKHKVNLKRKCPKCGHEGEGVIVLAGMGAKFFYCPKCSPKKKEVDDTIEVHNPEKALEE